MKSPSRVALAVLLLVLGLLLLVTAVILFPLNPASRLPAEAAACFGADPVTPGSACEKLLDNVRSNRIIAGVVGAVGLVLTALGALVLRRRS